MRPQTTFLSNHEKDKLLCGVCDCDLKSLDSSKSFADKVFTGLISSRLKTGLLSPKDAFYPQRLQTDDIFRSNQGFLSFERIHFHFHKYQQVSWRFQVFEL